jgi:hypothetical protein
MNDQKFCHLEFQSLGHGHYLVIGVWNLVIVLNLGKLHSRAFETPKLIPKLIFISPLSQRC